MSTSLKCKYIIRYNQYDVENQEGMVQVAKDSCIITRRRQATNFYYILT